MPKAIQFTPADVLAIRAEHAAGQLNVQAWADARGCAPETIRRVARRETYRDVKAGGAQPEAPSQQAEPDGEALAASLARLTGALAESAQAPDRQTEAAALVDALRAKAGKL